MPRLSFYLWRAKAVRVCDRSSCQSVCEEQQKNKKASHHSVYRSKTHRHRSRALIKAIHDKRTAFVVASRGAVQQLSRKRGQLGWRLNIFMDEISDSVFPALPSAPRTQFRSCWPNERLLSRYVGFDPTAAYRRNQRRSRGNRFVWLNLHKKYDVSPRRRSFKTPNSVGCPF